MPEPKVELLVSLLKLTVIYYIMSFCEVANQTDLRSEGAHSSQSLR